MASNGLPDRIRLAVFAKAPIPGAVKTRLIPRLGPAGAAALHAALARHALSEAIASGIRPVEMHCAPDPDDPFFRACAGDFGVPLKAQRGEDLGARMRQAFDEAFADDAALLLMGSDCPGLGARELRAARDALRGHDAVIVPAEDGGYVLIGLRRAVPRLFEDIDWGSARVLEQTRQRFAAAGVKCLELPALWDIDRPQDYERLRREGLLAEIGA
jgi:uncharacterized protein